MTGGLAVDASSEVVAQAARAAPVPDESRATDLLLDGLALLITDGYPSGTPVLEGALSAFRSDNVSPEERLRWSWLAAGTAGLMWDHETWDSLSVRGERLARDVGALSILPITLSTRVGVCLFAGEVATATSLVLRDQAEAYAGRLRDAGVPTTSVRFNGTIHDFLRLHALRDTNSTRAAVSLAVSELRRAFGVG